MTLVHLGHKKTRAEYPQVPQLYSARVKGRFKKTNLLLLYHSDEEIENLADFGFVIQGNGMASAGFRDGDVVYFQQVDHVDDIDDMNIAVVLIDGEYRLKRIIKIGDTVQLAGVGVYTRPLTYDSDIRVIGVAVEVRRRLLVSPNERRYCDE